MKGLIFTYLLTFGGSLAALFWPFYGILIYICFAILRPDAMWGWILPQLNYSRVVAIAMLLGWAGHSFGKWTFGRASLPVYALLGYYLWGVATSFLAPDPDLAWGWVESMFKIVLPFMAGITLIESKEQLKKVAWVITCSLGYVAREMYWSYVEAPLEGDMITNGFGGMDNNCWSIAMVCGAGLAFFLGLHETVTWRRWLAFICAGLMAHVPMFGDSRGGMLALVITGIAAAGMIMIVHFGWAVGGTSRLKPVHFAFFAVAIVIGLAMAGEGVRTRFASIFVEQEELDPSAKDRMVMWAHCRDFMLSNPVLGVGADHFPRAVQEETGRKKEAHSLWLQTGAELGLPGLVMLLTFYGSVVWRLWKLLLSKEKVDPWIRDAAQMVIAAIIGFAVSASFVTVEGVEPPYYVALIGCGLLKLASQQQAQAAQRQAGRAVAQARDYQPVG